MSDDIIDLEEYLDGDGEAADEVFAIWGVEGERSRFALPLWRAAFLAGGARAALVWREVSGGEDAPLHPLSVLDLAQDPARTEFDPALMAGVSGTGPPPQLFGGSPERLVVLLGEKEGRTWFLLVTDLERSEPLERDARDDLLFLSGECAGLLFHRSLGEEGGSGEWEKGVLELGLGLDEADDDEL